MNKIQSSTKLAIFISIVKGIRIMPVFFIGIHFLNIGFSGAQIGMIFGLMELTGILLILPSGLGSDKFKSKNLIFLSLSLIIIQYFGFAMSQSFPLTLIYAFLGGIGDATYRTSTQSLFHKDAKKQDVPKKIGLLHGLGYITTGLGMMLMGQLLNIELTFEYIFIAVAIALFICLIIGTKALPENQTTNFSLISYKKDAIRKEVLFFLFIIFLFSLHIGVEKTTYGLFLTEYLHLNKQETGLYMGSAVVLMSFTALFLGSKRSTLKSKNILKLGLLASGMGLVAMVNNNITISFIARAIHEMGDAAILFFIFYGISKLFDLERIGGSNSLFTFAMAVGASIGAMVIGPFGAIYGYQLPIVLGGITTLIALALTIPFTHLIDHE